MSIKYCVITEVRSLSGNLASSVDLYQVIGSPSEENDYLGVYERVDVMVQLANFRHPVFQVGEILITNSEGREHGYPGRKPAKWDVTTEEFDTVQAAINRAHEVMSQANGTNTP